MERALAGGLAAFLFLEHLGGNFLQRYFTTTEPSRAELEVAVESLNKLLLAEEERAAGGTPLTAPAKH